jgi:hypothetical protein
VASLPIGEYSSAVERQIVILTVVGSTPIIRPGAVRERERRKKKNTAGFIFWIFMHLYVPTKATDLRNI